MCTVVVSTLSLPSSAVVTEDYGGLVFELYIGQLDLYQDSGIPQSEAENPAVTEDTGHLIVCVVLQCVCGAGQVAVEELVTGV